VRKSAPKLGRVEAAEGHTLLPTAETTGYATAAIMQKKAADEPKAKTEAEEQAMILAKLKGLSSDKADTDHD
jgi:uncharacterized protein